MLKDDYNYYSANDSMGFLQSFFSIFRNRPSGKKMFCELLVFSKVIIFARFYKIKEKEKIIQEILLKKSLEIKKKLMKLINVRLKAV